MTSPGDLEPDSPGPGPAGQRVHPLVPPLALAVVTLIGAAIVIGFGHPSSSSKPVVKRAVPYRGGKLPRRPHGGGGPKKPVETPAAAPRWLARALGRREPSAPLVHDVSRDLRITITDRGFRIDYRGAHIARYATGLDRLGRPVRYVNGVLRRLALGADVTVVRDSVTNAYLLVGQRFGSRTWTWHLATNLRPRIRGDGCAGGWRASPAATGSRSSSSTAGCRCRTSSRGRAAGLPERLLGAGVARAGADEEQVGEPVQVDESERVEVDLLGRGERVPLGAAADGARDVQPRRELGPAGQDEAAQLGQLRVEAVAVGLEPVDLCLLDAKALLPLPRHR